MNKRHSRVRNVLMGTVLSIAAAVIAITGFAGTDGSQTAHAVNGYGPSNWFVKFDGVDGEALNQQHTGWSEILSFEHEFGRPDSDSGDVRSSSAVMMGSVVVTKEIDTASAHIAGAALNGKAFPSVKIHFAESQGEQGTVTYYSYDLKNAQIVSYGITGDGQLGGKPVERVAIGFTEFHVVYTEFDSNGNSKGRHEYTWKAR